MHNSLLTYSFCLDGIHFGALTVGVLGGIQVFVNDHDTTKGKNSLIDIHLTRLLAMHRKHYITSVMANGWHYCLTQSHSHSACLTLPIFVRTSFEFGHSERSTLWFILTGEKYSKYLRILASTKITWGIGSAFVLCLCWLFKVNRDRGSSYEKKTGACVHMCAPCRRLKITAIWSMKKFSVQYLRGIRVWILTIMFSL